MMPLTIVMPISRLDIELDQLEDIATSKSNLSLSQA
jgi:hypothetical protein